MSCDCQISQALFMHPRNVSCLFLILSVKLLFVSVFLKTLFFTAVSVVLIFYFDVSLIPYFICPLKEKNAKLFDARRSNSSAVVLESLIGEVGHQRVKFNPIRLNASYSNILTFSFFIFFVFLFCFFVFLLLCFFYSFRFSSLFRLFFI